MFVWCLIFKYDRFSCHIVSWETHEKQDTTDALPCHIHLPLCLWIMDPHSRAPKKNTSLGNEVPPQDTTHLIQRPCYQQGSLCQGPAGNWTTQRLADNRKETQSAVVWSCFPFLRSCQKHLARQSEQGKKTMQTEEEVGRQHQGMDRPGVQQVPEGSGEQGKWRKLVAKSSVMPNDPRGKGLMMIMMFLMWTGMEMENPALCLFLCSVEYAPCHRLTEGQEEEEVSLSLGNEALLHHTVVVFHCWCGVFISWPVIPVFRTGCSLSCCMKKKKEKKHVSTPLQLHYRYAVILKWSNTTKKCWFKCNFF